MDKLHFLSTYSGSNFKYRRNYFDEYLQALIEVSLLPLSLDRTQVEIAEGGIRWNGSFLGDRWLNLAVCDRYSALVFALKTCKSKKERKWILRREGLSEPPSWYENEGMIEQSKRTLALLVELLELQKDHPDPDVDRDNYFPLYDNLEETVRLARRGTFVVTRKMIGEAMVEDIVVIGDWRTAVRLIPSVEGFEDLIEGLLDSNFPVYKYCWLKNIRLPMNNYDDLISQYFGRPLGFRPGIYEKFVGESIYFRVLEVMLDRKRKTHDEIQELVDEAIPEIDEIEEYTKVWLARNFNIA
jgi:hypothetical protein